MRALHLRHETRGLWRPEEVELQRLSLFGPRPEGGRIYDVRGRDPFVVIYLRGERPLEAHTGSLLYVDLDARVIGPGPLLRRVVRAYPDPRMTDMDALFPWEHLVRPLAACEALHALRPRARVDLERRRPDGTVDRIRGRDPDRGSGPTFVTHPGVGHAIEFPDARSAAARCDAEDRHEAESCLGDWRLGT